MATTFTIKGNAFNKKQYRNKAILEALKGTFKTESYPRNSGYELTRFFFEETLGMVRGKHYDWIGGDAHTMSQATVHFNNLNNEIIEKIKDTIAKAEAMAVAKLAYAAAQRLLRSGDSAGYSDNMARHAWLSNAIQHDNLRLVDQDTLENISGHSIEYVEMEPNKFFGNTIYPVEVDGDLYYFW